MPAKWNFLPCFIFVVLLKIIVQKSIKHKKYSEILKKWDTQVIKWDTERSEKLVLISFFFFFLL